MNSAIEKWLAEPTEKAEKEDERRFSDVAYFAGRLLGKIYD